MEVAALRITHGWKVQNVYSDRTKAFDLFFKFRIAGIIHLSLTCGNEAMVNTLNRSAWLYSIIEHYMGLNIVHLFLRELSILTKICKKQTNTKINKQTKFKKKMTAFCHLIVFSETQLLNEKVVIFLGLIIHSLLILN